MVGFPSLITKYYSAKPDNEMLSNEEESTPIEEGPAQGKKNALKKKKARKVGWHIANQSKSEGRKIRELEKKATAKRKRAKKIDK